MTAPHILYGTASSLYTARVRSYLIKQHIRFEERAAGHPRFASAVIPAVGRFIMPVLETPDGAFIQDGVDIIDHFERSGGGRLPAYPDTPVLRALAHVFELFGAEGLLRPAMHYRWNFDADNLAFLDAEFTAHLAPLATPEEGRGVFEFASGRMRKAAAGFGVTPETYGLVEESFSDFLARLEAHLSRTPYLLGGRPTLGDYALIGPMFAHLGRDPHPHMLMKRAAPRVARWVERMNWPHQGAHEFVDMTEDLSPEAAIPETLERLLAFIAEDFLPELEAHAAFARAWLEARPDIEPGANGLEKPGARILGRAAFRWRGAEIETAVMPYRFWVLQRLQDAVAAQPASAQASIRALFARTGLEPLLDITLPRRVERVNHLEVWGPART